MTDKPAVTETRTPGPMQNGDLSHRERGGAEKVQSPSQTRLNATERDTGRIWIQNSGDEPWNGIKDNMSYNENGKLIDNDPEAGEAITPELVLRELTDVALNGNTAESRVMALELIGRHLGMFTDTDTSLMNRELCTGTALNEYLPC